MSAGVFSCFLFLFLMGGVVLRPFHDALLLVEEACGVVADTGGAFVDAACQILREEQRAFSSLPRCVPDLFRDDHELCWRSVSSYVRRRFCQSALPFCVGLGATLLVGVAMQRAAAVSSFGRWKGALVGIFALVGLYALEFRERLLCVEQGVPAALSVACIARASLAGIVTLVMIGAGGLMSEWLQTVRTRRASRAVRASTAARGWTLRQHLGWSIQVAFLSAFNFVCTYGVEGLMANKNVPPRAH